MQDQTTFLKPIGGTNLGLFSEVQDQAQLVPYSVQHQDVNSEWNKMEKKEIILGKDMLVEKEYREIH